MGAVLGDREQKDKGDGNDNGHELGQNQGDKAKDGLNEYRKRDNIRLDYII